MESESLLEGNEKNWRVWFKTCGGICGVFVMTMLVTVSATTVQLLRHSIPDFELNTIRMGFAFTCMCIYCLTFRLLPKIDVKGIKPTILYALTQTTNSIVFPISVEYIPIASSQCFSFAVGIISGTIIFRIILKEDIDFMRIVCNMLAILGIFFIVQPSFLFQTGRTLSKITHLSMEEERADGTMISNLSTYNCKTKVGNGVTASMRHYSSTIGTYNTSSSSSSSMTEVDELWTTLLGYAMAAATGISLTLDILVIRHFEYVRNNQHAVLFWTFLVTTLISMLLMFIFESPVLPNSTENYMFLSGHSVSSTLQWPLYFLAASYVTGGTINITMSLSSVFLLLSQYTILKDIHPGHRNWIEGVGVACVIVANMLSSIVELCRTGKDHSGVS